MKKNILITIIVVLLVLSGSLFAYIYFKDKAAKETKNLQKDSFTLTYAYKGNNTWEYTVDGTLPTPCFSATTDAVVMESYPEQVQIKVKAEENIKVDVCTTVVKEYTYSGTFNASGKATVSLIVE